MEYLQYKREEERWNLQKLSFKPCYKWNTFNTKSETLVDNENNEVLNLVINGIPSIHYQI